MSEEVRFEDIRLAVVAIWKKKVLVILMTIVFFLLGILVAINSDERDVYGASASVYGVTYGSYEDSAAAINAMNSYADILSSMKVSERAEAILGNPEITAAAINQMVTASVGKDSVTLNLYAYSEEPQVAVDVVNATAEAFVMEMQNILDNDGVQVLDSAKSVFQSENANRNKLMKLVTITLAGFGLSCAYFFLRELFSDQLRTVDQCMYGDEKILGIIPKES